MPTPMIKNKIPLLDRVNYSIVSDVINKLRSAGWGCCHVPYTTKYTKDRLKEEGYKLKPLKGVIRIEWEIK